MFLQVIEMCIFKKKKENGVKHILLIGDCIDSKEALFDFFREKLGKDNLIGSNLDALYDILSTVHEETVIEIINEYHLEKVLGKTYEGLISVLLDAENENSNITIRRVPPYPASENDSI